MRLKTIGVVLLFALYAFSPYFASVSANDEAAAGPDAGNTASQADAVYGVAEWYEGNVSAQDETDNYYHSYALPDQVGFIVVAGNHDLYFGYDNINSPPSTMNYAMTIVSAGSWKYIEPVTTSNTKEVYFYFTGVTTYDTGYCFGLLYVNSSTLGGDALNASEGCDSPQVAPNVDIVGGPTTDPDGSIDGGSIIDIEITTNGYVWDYDVYWWDEGVGILTGVDHNVENDSILFPALNYDSADKSALIYICLPGVPGKLVQEICSHTSYFTVSHKSSSNGNDCSSFNGMGGAVFVAGNLYMSGDIVEHPAGSNEFWLSMSDFLPDTPGPNTKWFGPCNCTDIGLGNMWDTVNTPYPTYSIVQDSNTIWISLDISNEEPFDETTGVTSNQWMPCANLTTSGGDEVPCSNGNGIIANDFNGKGGPVWNIGDPNTQDQIYEYPANSGQFYIARQSVNNPQAPGTVGWEEFWFGWCNCSEIWQGAGSPIWDSSIAYSGYTIVQWPVGSSQLWIANSVGASIGAEPNNSTEWTLCGGSGSGEGPCAHYNGLGGPLWSSTQNHPVSSIVEWPANSGEFWISLVPVQAGGNPPAPGDMWDGVCNCSEIWQDGGSPTWNANSVYTFGQIVENGGSLFISNQYSNQNNPTTNTKWWRSCGGEIIDPCDEFKGFAGPFYNQNQHSYDLGDIVEFPAGSGNYYVSTMNGNTAHPTDGELRGWKPCSCNELSDGTTWQPYTYYSPYKIVEHNGKLYIRKSTLFSMIPGDPEPGLSTGASNYFWRLCKPGHCKPVGLWNQNDANNGMYDQGVAVWTYWMGGIRMSTIDDNMNSPTAWSLSSGWGMCIHKPPKKWYPEPVNPPTVDPPGYIINRTHGKLLEDPTGNVVMSTVDMQDGDSGNNFPENCWFDNGGVIDWSRECTDEQRESPATFTSQMPRVVTGHCDMVGLENSNAVLMDRFEEDSQALNDVGGHLMVESTGAVQPHQCGAILLLSKNSFPNGEWYPNDDTTSNNGADDLPPWWNADAGEGVQSTYQVLVSDGEKTTMYYAINMIGKTCDMFEFNDETECYDKVIAEGLLVPTGFPVDSDGDLKDSDGDGVVDEWDECQDTEKDAATDSKGCKVDSVSDAIEDSEDTPGFSFVIAITALFCAIAISRKKL